MPNFCLTKEQVKAMRTKPDKRWSADAEGNIFDADFTHDAMFTLNGDFASNIQRQEYGEKIAALLNGISDETREVERLKLGLAWYASGQHYDLPDWENCSGESPNFLFPAEPAEDQPWMVEDGGVARAILDGAHLNHDEESDDIVIFPEAPK